MFPSLKAIDAETQIEIFFFKQAVLMFLIFLFIFYSDDVPPGEQPSIVIRLNDVQVQPGERAQFKVKIQGRPQPAVQWFKDSIEIQTHPYIEVSS